MLGCRPVPDYIKHGTSYSRLSRWCPLHLGKRRTMFRQPIKNQVLVNVGHTRLGWSDRPRYLVCTSQPRRSAARTLLLWFSRHQGAARSTTMGGVVTDVERRTAFVEKASTLPQTPRRDLRKISQRACIRLLATCVLPRFLSFSFFFLAWFCFCRPFACCYALAST